MSETFNMKIITEIQFRMKNIHKKLIYFLA